jgi:hypothetical protein
LKTARWIVVFLVLLALGATAARGELAQEGNLIVSFDGGISPHALPRAGTAPVAVEVATSIKAADGADPPPQLREISIAINREGRIFDRGLPTCRLRDIQPSTIASARAICGGAIVGNGRVNVRVRIPDQTPFDFSGPLIVFNAERVNGKRRLLAQVYGSRPPSSFVLTFRISRRGGKFGTVIKTRLPTEARRWAYVTEFEMRLRRTYTYGGQRHSYISAGCSAPDGYPGALYPFAKGTFEFAGGRAVSTTLIRDCKVR